MSPFQGRWRLFTDLDSSWVFNTYLFFLPLHHSKAHCRLHQQSQKHHYRSPQERYGPPSCRCMARRTQSPRRPLTATVRCALQLLIDNIYKHIDRFICPSINKCSSLHRNQSLKQYGKQNTRSFGEENMWYAQLHAGRGLHLRRQDWP